MTMHTSPLRRSTTTIPTSESEALFTLTMRVLVACHIYAPGTLTLVMVSTLSPFGAVAVFVLVT